MRPRRSGRAKRAVLVLVLALAFAFAPSWTTAQPTPPSMTAHFIDVGQGAASLLEFPCGLVLIDAGGQSDETTERLIAYLNDVLDRRGEDSRTLDAVFITHTHIDHNRALRRIVESSGVTVERYIHNGILRGSGRHDAKWMDENGSAHGIINVAVDDDAVTAAGRRGLSGAEIDPLDCGVIDPKIRVLSGRVDHDPGWPAGEMENGNNQSLVIRVDFGEASFLFTGDLEEHAIETLVDYYEGTRALDVDVYQVGHHGSYNGTTKRLLDAMTPAIAVIQMGRSDDRGAHTAWAYGHPRRDAVELVRASVLRRRSTPQLVDIAEGVRRFTREEMRHAIYATGWDGTVTIQARPDGRLVVRRER